MKIGLYVCLLLHLVKNDFYQSSSNSGDFVPKLGFVSALSAFLENILGNSDHVNAVLLHL